MADKEECGVDEAAESTPVDVVVQLQAGGMQPPPPEVVIPPPPLDASGASGMLHSLPGPTDNMACFAPFGVAGMQGASMLGALTATPGSGIVANKVADEKAGGKRAASDALRDRGDVSKKARGTGDSEDEGGVAHKLCPHNKLRSTCIECMNCPHGKRRQNCKDCNANSRQWCAHGKRRHDCQECSGCPHGKIKRSCKECSGSGVCSHGKLKRSCKECSTDMCEHKRRRYYCKECKGAGSCEHNHRRWRCRTCNEAYTCEHGFIKSNCLQCEAIKSGLQAQVAGGLGAAALASGAPADEKMKQDPPPPPPPNAEEAGKLELETAADSAQVLVAPVMVDQLSLDHAADAAAAELPIAEAAESPEGLSRVCVHKRWRVFCAECGGSGLCPHNKRKGTCKACGGAQFCEHKRLRRQCKVCRPELKDQKPSLCPHGKRKSRCRECGGASFCEHGRNRDWCKECGGKRLCEHQRQKHQCRECCAAGTCPHKTPDQCVGKNKVGRPRVNQDRSERGAGRAVVDAATAAHRPAAGAGARRGRPPKDRDMLSGKERDMLPKDVLTPADAALGDTGSALPSVPPPPPPTAVDAPLEHPEPHHATAALSACMPDVSSPLLQDASAAVGPTVSPVLEPCPALPPPPPASIGGPSKELAKGNKGEEQQEGGAVALYALSTAAATRLPAAASVNNLQAPGPGSGAKAADSKDKLGNHTTANKSGAPAGGGKRL